MASCLASAHALPGWPLPGCRTGSMPSQPVSPPETPPLGPQRPSLSATHPPTCCQGVPPSPWLALLPALAHALTIAQVDGLASIHEFKLGGPPPSATERQARTPRTLASKEAQSTRGPSISPAVHAWTTAHTAPTAIEREAGPAEITAYAAPREGRHYGSEPYELCPTPKERQDRQEGGGAPAPPQEHQEPRLRARPRVTRETVPATSDWRPYPPIVHSTAVDYGLCRSDGAREAGPAGITAQAAPTAGMRTQQERALTSSGLHAVADQQTLYHSSG